MKHYTLVLFLSISFLSCSDALTKEEIERYTEKGNLIVTSAAGELSGNLMSKMKEGGIPVAVEFCSEKALPITKEISDNYSVQIKRTSLKWRNPLNTPTENELFVIKEFQKELGRSELLKAKVRLDQNGTPHYYAPILIEKKCLMCHGTLNKELSRAADSIIKSYYPEDLATGFSEGDLRGIWSISFEKHSKSYPQ